jgi:V/A-type H+-transporting ATPase subunit D
MDINNTPTKGNLMQIKKTLDLSRNGYQLMDRKRIILMNELVTLLSRASGLQDDLKEAYAIAYQKLAIAAYENGMLSTHEAATNVDPDDGVKLRVRSVMGSEVPEVSYTARAMKPSYSFYDNTVSTDEARLAFRKVKELLIQIAEVENAAYRLANNMQKTQKRVNALQNVTIPQLEDANKSISSALEEKEREEFTRLKVVKRILNSK